MASRSIASIDLGGQSRKVQSPSPKGGAARSVASGLRDLYLAACGTVGQSVRVSETAGGEWTGVATGIDADGRLEVLGDDGIARAVGAGDVIHVRPA